MPTPPVQPFRHIIAVFTTLSALVAMVSCIDVTLPRVEPELTGRNGGGFQRSLLSDLAASVRDAAWPGDGGVVTTDAGRQLMEADAIALGRAVANRSLTVTAVTAAVLRLATDTTTGLAVTQPLAPLDACLVWRRRPSASVAAVRDGLYFLTVFHSSVWSILLLCLLLSIALLTMLESAHPIGMQRSMVAALRRSRGSRASNDRPLSSFHTLAFAIGALLLMGYHHGPKSTSGRLMALFWWMFAFAIAAAYLSATVLVILTTRSQPDAEVAGAGEILRQPAGRVVLCSAGDLLCANWARPELLTRANFTPIASDSAGLQQLLLGNADLLLLTHQFSCANLLAVDANHTYSMAIVAKATAWITLAGPSDLARHADGPILNLLNTGQLGRLERQHGMADVETYMYGGGSRSAGAGDSGVSDWLAELRLCLPYRIGSLYGPLVLLLVGFGLTLCAAACEFCYYRFFIDIDEMQLEAEELERKERALTGGSTMDTYL